MTTSSIENPAGSSVDSPELVLIVQISDTNAGSAGDLAALADALRETALDLLPVRAPTPSSVPARPLW